MGHPAFRPKWKWAREEALVSDLSPEFSFYLAILVICTKKEAGWLEGTNINIRMLFTPYHALRVRGFD